jgi:hypothetical protein
VGKCGGTFHGICEKLPRGWHDSTTTMKVLKMVYVCLKCREICEDIERLDKIWTVKFNNFEEKMTTNHDAILKIIETTEQNYIALTDDLLHCLN